MTPVDPSGRLELTWTNKHLRLLADEASGYTWVVEAKADRDLETPSVKGKEFAARRWAQHVAAQTGVDWRYLLVGETDVAEARGSWEALKQLSA